MTITVAAMAITMLTNASTTLAQQPQGTATPSSPEVVATFKSSIDLVRVSAFVRDRKGRFVTGLSQRDFEVTEGGFPRTITEFRHEQANLSVALLFDVSGSMEARMPAAREAATHLLSWLKGDDEAAVYTFDTRLDEVRGFTSGQFELPAKMSAVKPFGATSLHDAIARTAEKVAGRESLRRAVIVFTDGNDTSSRLTASEVSGMASAIDVPVFIVGIVPAIDNPADDLSATTVERSALTSSLSNLAYWTGGDTFIVSSIAERSLTARRIVDELRQQYLIAFEANAQPGWHPLEVRMKNRDLMVRARSGYFAGQSRPVSN
jgi:Ca-activated chloride channel family protein